jgi:PTS system nitrogen regulatory IIA component
VRAHLHLLSRLSFALKDRTFKKELLRQGSRDELLRAVERCESRLAPAAGRAVIAT